MSAAGGDTEGEVVVALTGVLTLGTLPAARTRLLAALGGDRPVAVDCAGATECDVAFVQLLESARLLATRLGTTQRLAGPPPAALAAVLAEGGFRGWAPAGSAA